MAGAYCILEKLDPARHGAALWQALSLDADARHWTYLPYGPFETEADYIGWLKEVAPKNDPLFYAILNAGTGRAVGLASYLRIDPAMGVIEVGHLRFSSLLQRRPAATEAMYLMMRRAFDELGYRRYEWKCDALNAPSRAAAVRLGLSFEGVFRQAVVVKGRNRDTAWYAITDVDWAALRERFERWLRADNFDADGGQITRMT
jgi:RimJ/RimL family protein N-acetyltransferase